MELQPTTVWAVRLGVSNEDFKGTLVLEPNDLVFEIDEEELRLALTGVRKVKRIHGSPVLIVEHVDGETLARFAFYFVKPPSLELKGRRATKHKVRRRGAAYLAHSNTDRKESVRTWESALKEAVETARQAGSTEA